MFQRFMTKRALVSFAILTLASMAIITSIPQSDGSTEQAEVRLDIGADDTLTLTEDTILSEGENIVQGRLIVPEGITLTVPSGTDLILRGSSSETVVNGTLIVYEGDLGICMEDGSRLIVEGSMEMKSIGIWRQCLAIERESHSQVIINGEALVEKGVTVYNLDMDYTEMLYGRYDGDDAVPGIVVNGKMTFNGTLNDEAVMLITGDLVMGGSYFYGIIYNYGGTIVMTDKSGVHCHITDLGMKTDDGTIGYGQENDILFTDICNITVRSVMDDGRNELRISGDLFESGIWRGKCGMSLVSGDGLFLDGPMRIDGLDINDGDSEATPRNYTLTITGDVEAYDSIRMLNRFAMFGPGNIIIEGTLSLPRGMEGDLPVTAAMYIQDGRYIYTTLENALSSGSGKVTLQGDILIDEDITVPEGTAVETQFNICVSKGTVLKVLGTLITSDGKEYSDVTLIGTGDGFRIHDGTDRTYDILLALIIAIIVSASIIIRQRNN